MKCLIVFSMFIMGCALAQNYNDGRYYPEVYAAKFDDGKWRPDNSGSYRQSGRFKSSENTSGLGSRLGNTFGTGGSSSSFISSSASYGTDSKSRIGAAGVFDSFAASKITKNNIGESSAASSIGIKEDTRQLNNDGSYYYRVLNENNIDISETGRLDNAGTDNEVMRVNGYYEYIGDDGILYRVDYVADENGFQPSGSHLPTPPPIPEAILRSLKLRGLARK